MSNWMRFPLRKSQIHYAALDAYISLEIFDKFKNKYNVKVNKYY